VAHHQAKGEEHGDGAQPHEPAPAPGDVGARQNIVGKKTPRSPSNQLCRRRVVVRR
jgi:hypothetical protein